MEGTDRGLNLRESADVAWVGRSDIDPYRDRCRGEFAVTDYDSVYDAVADVLTGVEARLLVLNAVGVGLELRTVIQTLLAQDMFRGIFVYSPVKGFWGRNGVFPFNGDLRVRMAADEDGLMDLLRENLQEKMGGELPVKVEEPPAAISEEPEAAEARERETALAEEPAAEIAEEAEAFSAAWPAEPPGEESSFVEIPPEEEAPGLEEPPVDEWEAESRDEAEGTPSPVEREEAEETASTLDELTKENLKLAQLTQEELDALLGGDLETDGNEG